MLTGKDNDSSIRRCILSGAISAYSTDLDFDIFLRHWGGTLLYSEHVDLSCISDLLENMFSWGWP